MTGGQHTDGCRWMKQSYSRIEFLLTAVSEPIHLNKVLYCVHLPALHPHDSWTSAERAISIGWSKLVPFRQLVRQVHRWLKDSDMDALAQGG